MGRPPSTSMMVTRVLCRHSCAAGRVLPHSEGTLRGPFDTLVLAFLHNRFWGGWWGDSGQAVLSVHSHTEHKLCTPAMLLTNRAPYAAPAKEGLPHACQCPVTHAPAWIVVATRPGWTGQRRCCWGHCNISHDIRGAGM